MMGEQKDIFDRMAETILPGSVRTLFFKNKMVLLYLFFGGLSFFLNMGLFALLDGVCHIHELIANVICWIACVLFQFVTNRMWVFDGRTESTGALVKQMGSFFGGRVFTLLVEEAIILVFITWLGFKDMIVKLVAQIVVIVLNYVISKWFVFRKT